MYLLGRSPVFLTSEDFVRSNEIVRTSDVQEPLVFRLWASSGLAKLPLDGWVDVPRLGHNTLQVRTKWPIYLVIGHFVLRI